MSQPEYEFTELENKTFSNLAGAMKFVAIVQLFVGGLSFLGGGAQLLGGEIGLAASSVLQGVLFLLIGMWTLKAAGHVSKIVSTEGSDIMHLMMSMAELYKLYSLQRVLFVITLVIVAAAFVLGIFAALM